MGRITVLDRPGVGAFAPSQSGSLLSRKRGLILLVTDLLLALALFFDHIAILLLSAFFRLCSSVLILVLHSRRRNCGFLWAQLSDWSVSELTRSTLLLVDWRYRVALRDFDVQQGLACTCSRERR